MRWLLCLLLGINVLQVAARENVILILVDDLGAHDLSGTGSRFYKTPAIDRLAQEGTQFTSAYSACTVCSPSRAAILTGQYPARLHLTDWIPGHARPIGLLNVPDWKKRLPTDTFTLSKAFSDSGYATAHIGKWHLGEAPSHPEAFGFKQNFGGLNQGQPASYFAPYRNPKIVDGPPGEYLTDRESLEAIRFIEENQKHPFFLYLAHHTVHAPIQAKAEKIQKYSTPSGGIQTNAAYAAMIESLDESIGRIVSKLKELHLEKNTIVVFTSDNGGFTQVTSNHPLRQGKGSPYEGGVRVPLFFWGAGIKTNLSISTPVIGIDLAPTLLELCGLALALTPLDGVSLKPLLKGESQEARKNLFWHYPHYHPGGARPYGAIRAAQWKLIEYFEDGFTELFDLENDSSETRNLANQLPAKRMELIKTLQEWRQAIGAQMPEPNPAFQPMKEAVPAYWIQQTNATISLHARDVWIHGENIRYEPQAHKNTVGYWSRPSDWVSWHFVVKNPGTYRVRIQQGCGPGSGGSDVQLKCGKLVIPFSVQETKGFQDFIWRDLGTFQLEAGRQQIELRCLKKPGPAVMDVREIQLVAE